MRYAFCPVCGGPLKDRAPGDTSPSVLVCSSCRYLFFQNSKPCTGAIVVRRAGSGCQILLSKRGIQPFLGAWDTPGGFLLNGEKPEDGLRRELEEELGVRILRMRLVSIQTEEYPREDIVEEARHTLSLYYLCTIPEEARLVPADDVVDARWFPIDDLPAEMAFPANRLALQDARPFIEAFLG